MMADKIRFAVTSREGAEEMQAVRIPHAWISIRDMGKLMSALRNKYAGQMDFGKASGAAKEMLQ